MGGGEVGRNIKESNEGQAREGWEEKGIPE